MLSLTKKLFVATRRVVVVPFVVVVAAAASVFVVSGCYFCIGLFVGLPTLSQSCSCCCFVVLLLLLPDCPAKG